MTPLSPLEIQVLVGMMAAYGILLLVVYKMF